MNPERPFSGPVSLSLAGLTLVVIAGWSFANGLSHELRVPRGDGGVAHVVVLPPKAALPPPGVAALAYVAPLPDAPVQPKPQRRAHRAEPAATDPDRPLIPPLTPAEAPSVAVGAADAAAVAPAPTAAPEAQPPAPAPAAPPPPAEDAPPG